MINIVRIAIITCDQAGIVDVFRPGPCSPGIIKGGIGPQAVIIKAVDTAAAVSVCSNDPVGVVDGIGQ